jgi:NAD(P)-dependent dehydrogenase (short-subunit alcohol dehydrogenase family)
MKELSEQTILITGSTDGLGKLVASHLAEEGTSVILHGRNQEKGEMVLNEIMKSTNNNKLKYYNADLSSLEEVKTLADSILNDYQQLDVLVNNAGIGGGPKNSSKREISKDGYELRFVVNYLSHFVLTHKLLELIKKSSPARIVNVSSIGQEPIDFEDVMTEINYDSLKAYRRSKLAQIMFTFDLAEELRKDKVTVNCLHPATLMNTNMVYEFFGKTMSTVEDGAKALEHLITSEQLENVTGEYFNGMKKSRANDQAYDLEVRKKLRELSLRWLPIK